MKPKLILCLALVLSGGLFVGCAVVKEHSASMSNPTDAENFISEIQMFDASNGWAQTGDPDDFRVLHTTDGGETWADVTPHPLPDKVWNCKFAKAQMAWRTVSLVSPASDMTSKPFGCSPPMAANHGRRGSRLALLTMTSTTTSSAIQSAVFSIPKMGWLQPLMLARVRPYMIFLKPTMAG